MQTLAEKETHCDFVDGLRGIAILMVMLNHWSGFVIEHLPGVASGRLALRWLGVGNKGVVLFFLVSAFTLFLSTRSRLQREKSPIRNFYLRRAFRILPLWWLAVTAYLLFLSIPLLSHLCCYTMFYGFTLTHNHPVIGAWTLFVEELFYLFFPLVLFKVHRPLQAVWLLVATYCLRLVWLRVAPLNSFIYAHTNVPFFPFAHWYVFAAGICLFFLYKSEGFRAKYLKSKALGHLADVVSVILVFRLVMGEWNGVDDLSVPALAAVFIAAASPFSFLGRFTRSPLIRQFGICCYSLYLFHGLVILMVRAPLGEWFPHSPFARLPGEALFALSFPIFALGMLLLGRVSFACIERPLVQFAKRMITRREHRDIVPTPLPLIETNPPRANTR